MTVTEPGFKTDTAAETIRVLFVDDEERIVEFAADFLERLEERFVVHTETSAAAAIEYLETESVDCIVSDYRMPEMDGLEFLDSVRADSAIPFILSTGKGSEEVASEAISAGVTDYLRKDTGTDQYEVLANRISNAVAQRRAEKALKERERRLAIQRDELATLNRINVVIQEITRGLIEAATREEIEATICEHLAASDLYGFAWIAEHDANDELHVRTGAGVDAADLGATTADGGLIGEPSERALETGDVQVLADLPESWRVEEREHVGQTVAAIPISYENVMYGVLAVHATRPDAFSERERAGFTVLGEVCGFAINAAQNMKLLLSDTAVALTLRVVDDSAFSIILTRRLDCRYTLNGVVPSSDGAVLQYVTVEGATPERVLELADEFPTLSEYRLISEHEEGSVFEFATSVSPVNSVIDIGGTVKKLVGENGETRLVCEVAADTDVRTVVEAFARAYPGSELVSKRAIELPLRTEGTFRQSLDGRLTEKQRAALRAAYFAGYYDWPRRSTAEEIANSVGVSSPTLHSHLRKAQRKLLMAFLGDTE